MILPIKYAPRHHIGNLVQVSENADTGLHVIIGIEYNAETEGWEYITKPTAGKPEAMGAAKYVEDALTVKGCIYMEHRDPLGGTG